jgi:hypothetical protein
MRPTTFLSLTFLLGAAALVSGACDISKIMDGDDGSDDGGGGEGGEGGEAGGSPGTCNEESPDCASCRACAANSSCKVAVDACLDDPLCSALDQCLAGCLAGTDCEESCRAQYAVSVDTYDAARQCMDCAVCPDLCSGLTVCE